MAGHKEKILITGANGFIGKFLVDEALKSGFDVYCTVRPSSDTSQIEGSGASILRVDYNDRQGLSRLFRDHAFTYILHNAGLTKSPSREAFMVANRQLLENIIMSVKESGIKLKKFVFVSSLAAYGPADFQRDGILNKQATPRPVTMYGESKLAAELFLKDSPDIPWLIFRPTIVYGPGEKDLFQVFKMVNNRLNVQPGMNPSKLTFIYVKDLAYLLVNAATSKHTHKAYFVTDGRTYLGDALAGFIAEALGKRTFRMRIPIPVVSLLARISEAIASRTGSYPILNQDKVNEIKARNWACDTRDLVEDFDFKPNYDLPAGVRETVQWYKENKWL
jgi:UDP-glucose 4-epimerase